MTCGRRNSLPRLRSTESVVERNYLIVLDNFMSSNCNTCAVALHKSVELLGQCLFVSFVILPFVADDMSKSSQTN